LQRENFSLYRREIARSDLRDIDKMEKIDREREKYQQYRDCFAVHHERLRLAGRATFVTANDLEKLP